MLRFVHALLTCLLLSSSPVAAQEAQKIFATNGVALGGIDPVAYFTQSAPVKGDPKLSAEWGGVAWHFSTPENRLVFLKSPEAFAPQFGGYCAYGVAKGGLYSTDPRAFTVHDGKLFLNHSLDVANKWRADIPGHLQQANENWPKLRK